MNKVDYSPQMDYSPQVDKLIEQLKRESELKTKWLSLIAHDFKGMFSNITTLLNAFQNEAISQETFLSLLPELKQLAEKNLKTLNHTFNWVNAQADGFSPFLEDIYIFPLFSALKEELKEVKAVKNISLHESGSKDVVLLSDRFLLRFILKQTLENAIKYSYPGRVVKMNLLKESGRCIIEIEDYGMGMNAHAKNNLFTLDGAPYKGSMDEKGAGLSMVLVKDFVEKLNGEIRVLTKAGEGTKVSFTFLENFG